MPWHKIMLAPKECCCCFVQLMAWLHTALAWWPLLSNIWCIILSTRYGNIPLACFCKERNWALKRLVWFTSLSGQGSEPLSSPSSCIQIQRVEKSQDTLLIQIRAPVNPVQMHHSVKVEPTSCNTPASLVIGGDAVCFMCLCLQLFPQTWNKVDRHLFGLGADWCLTEVCTFASSRRSL